MNFSITFTPWKTTHFMSHWVYIYIYTQTSLYIWKVRLFKLAKRRMHSLEDNGKLLMLKFSEVLLLYFVLQYLYRLKTFGKHFEPHSFIQKWAAHNSQHFQSKYVNPPVLPMADTPLPIRLHLCATRKLSFNGPLPGLLLTPTNSNNFLFHLPFFCLQT